MPTLSGLYPIQAQPSYFVPWRGARVEGNRLAFFSRITETGRGHEVAAYTWNGTTLAEVASVYGRTGDTVVGVTVTPAGSGWWVGISYGGGSHYLVFYDGTSFGTPAQFQAARPGLGGLAFDGTGVHTQYANTYRYHMRFQAGTFETWYFGSGPSLTWLTDSYCIGSTVVSLWVDGQAHARRFTGSGVSTEFVQDYRWAGNGALHNSGKLAFAYRGTSDYNYHRYAYLRERNTDGTWANEQTIYDAQTAGYHHVNFAAPAYSGDELHVLLGVTVNAATTSSEMLVHRKRDAEGAWQAPQVVWQASGSERVVGSIWGLEPAPEAGAGLGWILPFTDTTGQYWVALFAIDLKLGYTIPWWSSVITGSEE